jgi:hypothetical protein
MKKVTLMFENKTDLQRFEILIDFNHTDINLRKLTVCIEWDEAKMELALNAFNATIFEVSDN